MVKIEIIVGALVCTDTDSGLILISQPSKDIWYKEKDLTELDRISFYDANGIQGGAIYSKELPTIQLNEAVDSSLNPFTATSFREFATNFLGYDSVFLTSNSLSSLGWAQYSDTQYTSSSPLVVNEGSRVNLNNNAGSNITAHLPLGVTQLYDTTTKKITPVKLGDSMQLRVAFKAFTSSNNGVGEITLNIAPQITIVSETFDFPRGIGASNIRNFTKSNLIYALDTFMANGGEIFFESITGNTSIYDIVYVIEVSTKGK
tara:strand:- start:12934 stop:13713 length:780 start_codon:yes stop_codon:yes gene_type:complete